MAKYLLLCPLFCLATLLTAQSPDFLEVPVQDALASQSNVKSVQAKSYLLNPSGTKKQEQALELFEFDSLGHLVRQVEIEGRDTSKVTDYHYTQKGALSSKVLIDKVWDKRYKSGYRFNSDKTVFQEKSYELVSENASMLLDTKHYRYDRDGRPQVVLSYANNQVNNTHHYEYDEAGRLTAEVFRNDAGEVTEAIEYAYDEAGRLKRVSRSEDTRGSCHCTEEFVYTYNKQNKIEQITWLIDQESKGVTTYSYKEDGVTLLAVHQELADSRRPKRIVKEFEYQFY